jgi:putative membrane protein
MIRNFSDHAANERTFLAWVRTAIAVMAFGFLVAKFDLFLQITARSLSGGRQVTRIPGGEFGAAVGVVLILAGTLMVVLAGVRFVRTGRAIDSADPSVDRDRVDLVLAVLMVALGIAVLLYLVQTLLAGI